MLDCYVTKRGCPLESDKPLHREVEVKMAFSPLRTFQ